MTLSERIAGGTMTDMLEPGFGLRADFAHGFTEADRGQADAVIVDPSLDWALWQLSNPPALVVTLIPDTSPAEAEALSLAR
jgi:hypothetical protein